MKKQDKCTMYVYDRVCPRESKRREILSEYGTAPERQWYDRSTKQNPEARKQAPYPNSSSVPPKGSHRAQGKQPPSPNRPNQAYNYRPGRAQGGEAVKERPLKLVLERFINLFVSVEDRGRQDETIAKRQAIAWKKLVEHRWSIFITLLLLAVVSLFALAVFRFVFVIRETNVDGSGLYTETEILDAAGIAEGENLYSFDAADAEREITFRLPMIGNAEISRTIPTAVSVTVSEDEPAFLCNVWGDTLILSAGLRVLGVTNDTSDLPVMTLPPVDYSVAGRVLTFAEERNERYIRSVLKDLLASSLWSGGLVDAIDLSDEYDITMTVSGRYQLRLGGEDDCAHKLKLAYKTITSSAFTKDMPARIDLRDPEKAAVNYSHVLGAE